MGRKQCCLHEVFMEKYFINHVSPSPTITEKKEKLTEKNGYRPFFKTKDYYYVGKWKENKFSGMGRLSESKNKDVLYEGQFVEGSKQGVGTLYKLTPKKEWSLYYSGKFANGYPEGLGHLRLDNEGSDFFGDMQCGKRHGFGKAFYDDGSFYFGSWKNDKREGRGLAIYKNDTCYEGSWFNDLPHGYGVFFFFRKGVIQEGVWIEGVCKTSKIRVTDNRQSAAQPIVYPIPKLYLLHGENVFRNWERQAADKVNAVKWRIKAERMLKKNQKFI